MYSGIPYVHMRIPAMAALIRVYWRRLGRRGPRRVERVERPVMGGCTANRRLRHRSNKQCKDRLPFPLTGRAV